MGFWGIFLTVYGIATATVMAAALAWFVVANTSGAGEGRRVAATLFFLGFAWPVFAVMVAKPMWEAFGEAGFLGLTETTVENRDRVDGN